MPTTISQYWFATLLAFFLIFPGHVRAQQPAALTNDSIIKMVKAGLSEGVIVSMVQTQPANYMLSPDDLIALKSAGVLDSIVSAMIEKNAGPGTGSIGGQTPSGATTIPGTVSSADPNDPMAPHDSGIYLNSKDSNGQHKMIILEQAAYQGTQTGGTVGYALTYGIHKIHQKAVIPSKNASTRTAERQPVFYFYFEDKAAGLGKSGFTGAVSNPNQFALVKFDVTKSSRETTIGEFGTFGSSSGTSEKSMVPFKSEQLKPGLYKVTPSDPMHSGEYCFIVSLFNTGAYGAGAAGSVQIFDFAVTSDR